MSTLPQSASTTPSSARRKPGPKPKSRPSTSQPSLIIKLRLKPSLLSSLASSPLASAVSPPNDITADTPSKSGSPADDANGTTTPVGGAKRKGVPGPKPGAKRSRVSGVTPGKPGRKKAKLDTTPGAGFSKLGPKSNTGAINDKLRALDRSGAPCRRWHKAAFTLKSFTGVVWTVPTWARPADPSPVTVSPPAENGVSKTVENGEQKQGSEEKTTNGDNTTPVPAETPAVEKGDPMQVDTAPPTPAKKQGDVKPTSEGEDVKTEMPALPQGITA